MKILWICVLIFDLDWMVLEMLYLMKLIDIGLGDIFFGLVIAYLGLDVLDY